MRQDNYRGRRNGRADDCEYRLAGLPSNAPSGPRLVIKENGKGERSPERVSQGARCPMNRLNPRLADLLESKGIPYRSVTHSADMTSQMNASHIHTPGREF